MFEKLYRRTNIQKLFAYSAKTLFLKIVPIDRLHSDSSLTFKATVYLLFDPISALRFIGLNIDIVDEGAEVFQGVQVGEQLVHIVGHFLLV